MILNNTLHSILETESQQNYSNIENQRSFSMKRKQIPHPGQTKHNETLTTPGRHFSASMLGPSQAAGVEPVDESDEESGDEGMELFRGATLAVISCGNTVGKTSAKATVSWYLLRQ